MPRKKFSVGLIALLTIMTATLLGLCVDAVAQETVLYNFSDGRDGGRSRASVILDAAGNLYGTTTVGGDPNYHDGAVFELTPTAGGSWTETVLYGFNTNGASGVSPSASLTFDTSGNLYGTTPWGGSGACGGNYVACGTVFELTPAAGGGWTETVLHSFSENGTDGINPYASIIFDAAGNIYGTTAYGGAYGEGTVFELSPAGGGVWTEKILHSFNPKIKDGTSPAAGLAFDAAGNLYGTTQGGGGHGGGTVFELTPAEGGNWTEKILHAFNPYTMDGNTPYSGVILDAAGNIYGTTFYGGVNNGVSGYGTVFELSPKASGGWSGKTLHNFNPTVRDGYNPFAGVIFDGAGNLYGTTLNGGTLNGGTAFKLTPTAKGTWRETVLHSFYDSGRGSLDGANPYSSLILDAAGHLYGTTYTGGDIGGGVVFEIKP